MEVCITDPHFTTVTVVKDGYNPNTQNITQYPVKDQTIDIYANLTPVAVQPVANFTASPDNRIRPATGAVYRYINRTSGYVELDLRRR